MNTNLENHPAFQVAEQLKNRLLSDDASQIKIEDRDFIISIIEYFESRITVVCLEPTIGDTLNRIQNQFQTALNEINKFLVNKNYTHINNARNHLTNTVSFINSIPFFIPKQVNLSKIAKDFKNLILTDSEEIKKRLDNINKDFDVKVNNINNKFSELNQKASNIDQKFNEQQQKINQLFTTFQNDYNQLKLSLNEDIKKEKEKINVENDKYLKELSNKLEEAKKIINIIGNIGVTGDYQQTAEYHRKQANLWRWISVFIMFIAVVYLAFTVLKIGQYDWHISLLRILSITLFIYPAQYAANQSKIHREQEIYNKKMELDLAAINPFIELFDEKKKQEIKEKLVEKYFGNNAINKTESDIPITVYEKFTNQFISIIKSIKDIIK